MNSLPQGTVTFLFTDIQGSTHLWETQPALMQAALKLHDELLRQLIHENHGQVFNTAGDAFHGVFVHARDALRAAVAIQRRMQAEAWPPEIGDLKVRIALHTGDAEQRDGDYFGQTLNRIARLEAAGHGGQILVSNLTQALLRDDLPERVTLLDLGVHRLKDLLHPETIYQVVIEDLPADFPPLNTLDSQLNNLPGQLTPFIGRDRELTAVLNLMHRDDVRLVTLTGPGGTGKTRLSLATATDLVDHYEHGVWFVDLSTVHDSNLVITMVASTLRIKEQPGQPLGDTVTSELSNRQLLLILDNFEQVMEAAAFVGEVLSAAPQVKMIVTSREVLRVYGEHVYPVPPLGLPEANIRHQTAAILSEYEAVRLFIQRAQAANPAFSITEENASTIAEICRRLDGLPLAIELAAARIRMMMPEAILKGLDNSLKMLAGGARDLPARQQTIRGAIEWSYDLLDEQEQRLFARLGIFNGGWSLEAAEALCSDGLDFDMFTGIETLLDKSLIRQTASFDNTPRFSMLETLRAFALDRLHQLGEADTLAEAHARYFQAFIEQLMVVFFAGEIDPIVGVQIMERDYANVHEVLSWGINADAPGWTIERLDIMGRLPRRLFIYWMAHNMVEDGRRMIEDAIRLIENEQSMDDVRASLYSVSVTLAVFQGFNLLPYRPRAEEAVRILRKSDDDIALALTLLPLGAIAMGQGDFETAAAALEESGDLLRKHNATVLLATVLGQLGTMYMARGDLDRSEQVFNEIMEFDLRMDRNTRVATLNNLGEIARCKGDYATAREYYQQIYDTRLTNIMMVDVGRITHNLGFVALHDGELEQADSFFRESLEAFQDRVVPRGYAECALGFGALALLRGQPERAVILMAASQAEMGRLSSHRWAADQIEFERYWAQAQQALDAPVFEKAQAEGEAMLIQQALDLALDGDS